MHLTICIMVGLPASGKTTLTKLFKDYISKQDPNTHVCIASYDQLIPQELDLEKDEYLVNHNEGIIETALSKSNSLWKLHRSMVFNAIQNKLSYLFNKAPYHKSSSLTSNSISYKSLDDETLNDADKHLQFCDCFSLKTMLPTNNHVVLIDDNMFYKSMRYIYYQLARQYSCSYCQIYMKSMIKDSMVKNSKRGIKTITNETIIKMASLLEEPDKLHNSWETQTLVIDSNDWFTERTNEYNIQKLQAVYKFLLESSLQIVEPLTTENDLIMQEIDRKKCLDSFVHQCDQSLRKYISTTMNTFKMNGHNKTELKVKGKTLNEYRKSFLNMIKNEEIHCLRDFEEKVDLTDEWKSKVISLFTEHLDSTEIL